MTKGRLKVTDEGIIEVEPTSRLALLWSFDPISTWKPPHQMVGSVHAHKGHLDIYGAVYWSLRFKASQEVLDEYECPLSGYLYNSALGIVQFRARVIEMTSPPRKEFLDYVPMWRIADVSRDNVYLLIDQIDEIFPYRLATDFQFFESGDEVASPTSGNYFKVLDPLL